MSSRLVVLLACATALAGCRDLVQSGDPPPVVYTYEGLLLDPLGMPLTGARVYVDNDRYRSGGDRVSWDGETNGLGRFYPQVAEGALVDVRATLGSESPFPRDFRFLRRRFSQNDALVLQLPMERFEGRFAWAEGTPLEDAQVRLRFQYLDDGWYQNIDTYVAATGSLDVWLTPGQLYSVYASASYSDNYLNFSWPEKIQLDAGNPLDLVIPDVGFDVTVTMGSQPAQASLIGVFVEGQVTGSDLAQRLVTGQGPLRAHGFAEVCSVEVFPLGEAPFLRQRFYVDLSQPNAAVLAELGRYRLDVRVVNGEAVPWVGASVRVRDVSGYEQNLPTDTGGQVRFYLQRGDFLVEAAHEDRYGDYDVSVPVSVDADDQVTLVLQ